MDINDSLTPIWWWFRKYLEHVWLQTVEMVLHRKKYDDNAIDTPTPLMIPGRLDHGIQVVDPLELGDQTQVLDNVWLMEYHLVLSAPSSERDSPVDLSAPAPFYPSEVSNVIRQRPHLCNCSKRLEIVMPGTRHDEFEWHFFHLSDFILFLL